MTTHKIINNHLILDNIDMGLENKALNFKENGNKYF